MIRCSAFRFFLVAAPPPVWMIVALVLFTASGCATLWLNPSDVDSALGPMLLLQMFAVSTGFTASAARGHFDPILVGSRSRVRIGLAAFAAAAAPGLCAWLALVACAVASGAANQALAPHRTVSICLVSAVAWGVGLGLPRLAAGAAWSMMLLALAISRDGLGDALLVVQQAPESLRDVVAASAALLVCPFLFLGDFPAARDRRVVLLVLALASLVIVGAILRLRARDYALVDPA